MNDYLTRSKELLGESAIESLADKTIVVIGLGGVGGTALIALARSGFKHFIIIDGDEVNPSNLNRQLLFNLKDISKNKALATKEHLLEVVDDLDIVAIPSFISKANISELNKYKIDYIIDAIDKIDDKMTIIEYALNKSISFTSSLGMGNRLDPEQVCLTTLNKTENDPLARKMRHECKLRELDLKIINVVFSKENPIVKKPTPSSMVMVPSTAGLLLAKSVIVSLIKSE